MILRILNAVEEGIISLLLVGITLLVFVQTILRFGFGEGLIWGGELTLILAGWMVMFGASHGLKVGSHIGVDVAVKLLPSTGRRIVTAIAVLGALFYCALFIKGSWVYLRQVWMIQLTLEELPVPLWIAHAMTIVGFAMIALRLLILLWQVIVGRADGFAMVNEADESLAHLRQEQAERGDNPGDMTR